MALPAATVATVADDTDAADARRPVAGLTRAMARLCDEAWREFHEHYYDRLLRYALTLHNGDRAAAEDALQSGFLRMVRHIRCFDDDAVFWSWLTLLVRCAAADQGRKSAARTRLHDALEANAQPSVFVTGAGNETTSVLLEEALARLDEGDRLLLSEKYDDRRSTQSMASGRGISEKAVECRLRRLRKKLKATIHALDRQTRT